MSRLILPRRFAAENPSADPYSVVSAPIHLTTRALSVAANSAGGVNAVALRNPHGYPMEIQEFKFRAYIEDGDVSSGDLINGASVLISLSLVSTAGDKRTSLTNGPMAIWSFAPGRDIRAEYDLGSTVELGTSEYHWLLSRPFYVPAGYGIEPVISTTSAVWDTAGAFPIKFEMSVSGRALMGSAPKPGESCVPFAAGFMSKPFDIGDAADSDVSQETDLMNTTGKVLNVDRFVGRFNSFGNSTTVGGDVADETCNRITSLRIVNSRGDAIVDRSSPIRLITGADERAIEVPHQMQANDFYQVLVEKEAPTNDSSSNSCILYFSMVGWRSVPLREL